MYAGSIDGLIDTPRGSFSGHPLSGFRGLQGWGRVAEASRLANDLWWRSARDTAEAQNRAGTVGLAAGLASGACHTSANAETTPAEARSPDAGSVEDLASHRGGVSTPTVIPTAGG